MIRVLWMGLAVLAICMGARAENAADRAVAEIAAKTGLKPVYEGANPTPYLGKTHRGYPILYTAAVGAMWDPRWQGALATQQIDEPMSLTMVLRHGKAHASRLDIVADGGKVGPAGMLPKHAKVSATAGSIYSADDAFADRIAANAQLMKRMKNLTGEYVRVDAETVTLFWAGSMPHYTRLINYHGDYTRMLDDMMDDLADIADAIPAH